MPAEDLPEQAEHGGGDAESDDIGEGVELAAKVGLGVGHSGDASVEGVERDGKKDREGGAVEVAVVSCNALHALSDGVEASGDVAGGEEGGKDEHAAAGTTAGGAVWAAGAGAACHVS